MSNTVKMIQLSAFYICRVRQARVFMQSQVIIQRKESMSFSISVIIQAQTLRILVTKFTCDPTGKPRACTCMYSSSLK